MKSEAIPFAAVLAGAFFALAASAATPAASPAAKVPAVDAAGFDRDVKPILKNTCSGCHNSTVMSGGVNLLAYTDPSTVATDREAWEKILQKVESGEMPPRGIPRPPQDKMAALVKFVHSEFDKQDAAVKPDPGRVTARRLNRNEYRNTIRDLLAVDFRADKDFPTDDSGYGFDNIADILTVSPVLMEKYLNAAETISSRAMGADPLPKKPLLITYDVKDKSVRRLDYDTIEASHRVDWDGEYTVRFGFPGQRGPDAKPVKMGFYMDGQLLQTIDVETKPSKLVYFNPYSDASIKIYLPEGDHVFRAQFLNDDFVKQFTTDKAAYSTKLNKYIDSISFEGPFPSNVERASRKKILICDPKTGEACVEKIVANLATHAYRRPVSKTEVAGLMKFVTEAKAHGQSTEQGIQLALEAMLVSPDFLFRIERDPAADAGQAHRITDVELASRLSYFLWSSMPDDTLLSIAEAGKLHDPAVLDAQVKRMLDDKRSSAFADNFAGQWLEIRNLDSLSPDPKLFPQWTPELKEAMRTETRMFFDYMLRENRPMPEFLSAKYTFLNDYLAKFYGIDGVTGPDFRKVDLSTDPNGDERGGILTEGAVLAVSSYPSRTSPTIRGKYILNNILGTPPPPPPPDVPALDASKVGSEVSLRQQLEAHRANPVCASCHAKMDVLGFGLENYNAIGQWRTKDGKFPIDVSGTMPDGKSFKTAPEMRAILLASMPQFAHCMTEKMMTYAIGRGMDPSDNRALNQIDRKLEADGYHFQTLIYAIVHSLPFQERRGEVITTQKQDFKEIARK